MMRAATEAAAAAFALSASAVLLFYTFFLGVDLDAAVAPALGLGLLSCATVYAAVCVLVVRRSRNGPVLGARRGASVAVVAVIVVAAAHTGITFGSGGFLYSLLGQVGYACLVAGVPAAIVGAMLGSSLERRLFTVRDS